MASIRLNVETGPVEVMLPAVCSIGRSKTNMVALPNDRFASKEHAVVLQEEGAYFLEDLSSRNGTFIERGDRKLKVEGRERLHNGDVITVGVVRMTFLGGRSSPRAAAPAAVEDYDPEKTQIGGFPGRQPESPDETVFVSRGVARRAREGQPPQ